MPSWYKRFIGPAIQVLRIDKPGFNSQLQDNIQILTGRKKIVYHKFTRSHGNQTLDLQATERRVKSKKRRPKTGGDPAVSPANGDVNGTANGHVPNGNLLDPNRPLSGTSSRLSLSTTRTNIASEVDNLFGHKISSRQGKSASLTTERRHSLSDVAVIQHRDKATKAHRRWVKKNRIRDASCGDDEDSLGVDGSAANVVLYIGLGLVCVGMVISFVGLGEKGFKTAELRLIGPSLLAAGAFFCLLRVLFCTCPAACCCLCPDERRRRRRHKRRRRKQRGEVVSSSDDEKPTVSTIITRRPPPFKVNGDQPQQHVVIPINRLPATPSPTPRAPGQLLAPPSPHAALPNYIGDSTATPPEPLPGPSGRPRGHELVLNASMLV